MGKDVGLVLTALLLDQVAANELGGKAEAGPSAWGPITHMWNMEEAPGPWLQFGSVPDFVAIWRVNQQIQDLSVYSDFKLINSFEKVGEKCFLHTSTHMIKIKLC